MKTTIAKNLKMIAAGLMLTALTACNFGRTTTIVENTDNSHMKIKYNGTIVFNQANDGIEHISPGGYLEYEHDDNRFEAKQHVTGGVFYRFTGDSEINQLSAEQKHLVGEAIANIEKARKRK